MIEKRIARFRQQFETLGIDAALIISDVNRNYLTGFTGDESFAIITKNKAFFITDSRYTEQAKKQVKNFEIIEYKPPSVQEYIKKIVLDNEIKRIGFEEDRISFSEYEKYKETLEGIELIKLNGAVENLRIIKDEEEIELISKAAQIADDAFLHILNFIKPNMTEKDVALELEFFMRQKGASKLSFDSIVASGNRSSLPHGVASDKVIEKGDFLTLDFGCIYEGYCSDMTRTIVIGKADDKQKEIYNIVLEANKEALEAIKPKMACCEIDKIARDIISNKGYGDRFGHGLGHGVGREIHEQPRLSAFSKAVLEKGMVVTDEPGIYIPEYGGVRIEDLVLVTEDGYKVLSKSSKELIEL
ncbi:Xaa-Pro aminopeptidase [Caloramator quimbayensis]|uniref:Xaa-Pro aminopeptidase n=1 Tax=Caloramator quimbayensis TaxID=1147123 RepID=A0A1T4WYG6_9CLOT|nr:Xaa-Pro peptidase family protein [Caloramator quimbayensis]SKA81895.1 Xaa-Pro aminopeptidase [Caloramator quimbayensis]